MHTIKSGIKNDHVKDPRPADETFWFKAHVFPNGDLLAVVEGNGSTPWGQGLIKIDTHGNLIWKFLECAHHDFSIGEDGRIYALTHRIRTTPLPDLTTALPVLEDFVVVLSADGVKQREMSLLEAFGRSKFRYLIDQTVAGRLPLSRIGLSLSPLSASREYLHANAVRVIEPPIAQRASLLKTGQVCVSLPLAAGLGIIAGLDIESGILEWALNGPWCFIHDPDFLPDGRLLIFDNYGDFDGAGYSRVLEIDPTTSEILWSYGGRGEDVLESGKRSGQQRLPNGNTLITESDAGRLVEVTGDGDIVWEFVNPVRRGAENNVIPVISTGERYPPEYFDTAVLSSD